MHTRPPNLKEQALSRRRRSTSGYNSLSCVGKRSRLSAQMPLACNGRLPQPPLSSVPPPATRLAPTWMQRAVQCLQPLVRAMSHSTSSSALAKFSTCELSDALIKLGVPHGGHIPDIHIFSPSSGDARICGPAYTVQMVLGSDKSAPKLSQHFVDTTPAGSVVVIAAPPRSVLSFSCRFISAETCSSVLPWGPTLHSPE